MGMYTGLRGSFKLKDEYLEKFSMALESENGFSWEEILQSDNEYYNYNRNSFIPRGSVCYMPADWDDFEQEKLEGNLFTFCCSLKDYQDTIEMFIAYCLPTIAESWDLEELYEEDEFPTRHAYKP